MMAKWTNEELNRLGPNLRQYILEKELGLVPTLNWRRSQVVDSYSEKEKKKVVLFERGK